MHPLTSVPTDLLVASLPFSSYWGLDYPIVDHHAHCRHILGQGGARVTQHREKGGLSPALQPDHHQLHVVVWDTVTQLGSQICQQVSGGATPTSWEKVVRCISDPDSVECNFPTIPQHAQSEGEGVDIRVPVGREEGNWSGGHTQSRGKVIMRMQPE